MGKDKAPKVAKKNIPAKAIPETLGRIPRRLRGVSLAMGGNGHHIVYRTSLIDRDYDGGWSWKNADIGQILDFLAEMERLTWLEITSLMTGGRRRGPRNKFIPVESLCNEARDRLVELGYDDMDELFRFRHGNMGRLWGLLMEEGPLKVFYPIWWDADHKVCPSNAE